MRRHPRYKPREGYDFEIQSKDEKIYALLVDICVGGMRVVSTDDRIGESDNISLSVDDFRVDLPCEKIRKIEYNYGIKFGPMEDQDLAKLEHFIEHYTKKPQNPGAIEISK
jgi:hypothetical protein